MAESDSSRPAGRIPDGRDLGRSVSLVWRFGAAATAALSGVFLSLAYPPVDAGGLAWIALVPFLLWPPSPRIRTQAFRGLILGAAWFLPCLFWLRTVTWVGWFLLSMTCAALVMFWAILLLPAFRVLHGTAPFPKRERKAPNPIHRAGAVLLIAAVWTAIEWLRATIFTGFPWDMLGGSQWKSPMLLGVTAVTGVYGLSFLLVATNAAITAGLRRWVNGFRHGIPRSVPWESIAAGTGCIAALWAGLTAPRLGQPDNVLRVAAVQGCLPQTRQWTQKQLQQALEVYDRLSRTAAHLERPQMIVWPETAVPAPLRWDEEYAGMFQKLLTTVPSWFLIGTIEYRFAPGVTPGPGIEPNGYNSAFLFNDRGELKNVYDKTHLVPFGEYTPFERLWPWLTRWIGMGRSLTPGREYTVFAFPRDVRAGVNICYEDAFPGISREFVRRGANLLITLTNDAWYAETAGSAQHLCHAVLRAAENRRPLLRSGNNSDTCLILPNGHVTGLLRDPVTGNRFVRGVKAYQVPVWWDPPLTFYTRHGDWFAGLCVGTSLLWIALLAGWDLHRRAVLRDRIRA